MKNYILTHSEFFLVQAEMQSRESYFVPPAEPMNAIPKDVENLYFCGYKSGDEMTVLKFASYGFTQLRSITIGSICFMNAREFVLDGLEKLEYISLNSDHIDTKSENPMQGTEKHADGVCQITNCPSLRKLDVGDSSFRWYERFELSNVNSLQSVNFGRKCFEHVNECVLKGK